MYQTVVASFFSVFYGHSWCKESLTPAVVTQLVNKKNKKSRVDVVDVTRRRTTLPTY